MQQQYFPDLAQTTFQELQLFKAFPDCSEVLSGWLFLDSEDYSVVLWGFLLLLLLFCTHSSIHYFSEPLLQLTETMKSAFADTQGSCHFSSQSVTTASGY